MPKKIKVNQLAACPLKPGGLLLSLDVQIHDQSTKDSLSRSMAGLSPSRQAALGGKLLSAMLESLESKKVVRLECAHVLVDDTSVGPPRLKWFPGTYESLSELPGGQDATIHISHSLEDRDVEPGARFAFQKCYPVLWQYGDLVLDLAAFGDAGNVDPEDWEVAAFVKVDTLKLRDGTYISVAEFYANPRAYFPALA